MEQDRIIELLTRKVAGEATVAELRELERLLADYPDALYYEEALKQLWTKQRKVYEETETAYALHREKFKEDFAEFDLIKRKRALKRLFVFAAIALPVIVIGYFTYYFYKPETVTSNTEIVAGKGVRKKVLLPDGSTVWLNAGSSLKYDGNMKEQPSRLVSLTGEAYFDVAEDKSHPFIIRTEKFSVKVLGTAFNVRSFPKDKQAEATLIRGSIELALTDRPQQKFILKPKEKFEISEIEVDKAISSQKEGVSSTERKLIIESVKPVEISNQQYIKETSWIDNKLVFKNESFEELLPKLERWYNVTFQVTNNNIKSYRFTGVFEKETVEEALSAMQLIRAFNFKKIENDVILIN